MPPSAANDAFRSISVVMEIPRRSKTPSSVAVTLFSGWPYFVKRSFWNGMPDYRMAVQAGVSQRQPVLPIRGNPHPPPAASNTR